MDFEQTVKDLKDRQRRIASQVDTNKGKLEALRSQYKELLAKAKEDFGVSTVEELSSLVDKSRTELTLLLTQAESQVRIAEQVLGLANK